MKNQETVVRDKFRELFNKEPLLVRSPGRINLIGEHTDYNDGFVMPAAIDKEIVFAIAPSGTETSSIFALQHNAQVSVSLAAPKKVDQPKWANYLLGVLYQMVRDGYHVKPFNCVFGGEVPLGAGLSSSAALECGYAFALNELFNLNIDKLKLVKMAQWSEHNYVGVKCGIMDQFASVMGKEGHVILLDCRSLEHGYSPIDLTDYVIVLCDTKVKHSLVDSEYNTRRAECEEGVSILKKHYPRINSLRDVTSVMVQKHRDAFPGKVYQRCAYVAGEIERVQLASKDLDAGDLRAFGAKMFETHEGLSKMYEVSCPELDFLVDEAKKRNDVVGARMMGGGFGGCTINLVRKDSADRFIREMTEAYGKQFSINMPCYKVSIKDGTSVLSKIPADIND